LKTVNTITTTIITPMTVAAVAKEKEQEEN